MADHISPTYSSGMYSICSLSQVSNLNNDFYNRNTALTGSTVSNGYINIIDCKEVGSFNSTKNNRILSKVPVNTVLQQS